VGMVELQHCVTSSASPWFHGPIGWVLTNARKTPFIRIKGRLGLFDAPLTGDVARTLKSAPR
jgi:hypothetical protein